MKEYNSGMKITRRALVSAGVVGAVLAPSVPAQTPLTPDDLLSAARELVKRNGESLSKIAMPMATEPAFTFKA